MVSLPAHLFPQGHLDQNLQQVDLRDRNSCRLLLAEVSSVELLETQLIKAIVPFILNARLKPLRQFLEDLRPDGLAGTRVGRLTPKRAADQGTVRLSCALVPSVKVARTAMRSALS